MIPGSATRTLASAEGRRVMTMNRNGDWGEQRLEDAAVETSSARSDSACPTVQVNPPLRDSPGRQLYPGTV
ncbi:hypothetical protein SSPO_004230 [Streptomyces antimycoticus]|uniref:Uncharacterized protein n=1 Tax=Streptomyces antimycoticus TaxID=68175 RepID=A0A499UAH7_9ACTN|nr:hypothetical protein SSPO_004230 [Streptomyces antimycoticus]